MHVTEVYLTYLQESASEEVNRKYDSLLKRNLKQIDKAKRAEAYRYQQRNELVEKRKEFKRMAKEYRKPQHYSPPTANRYEREAKALESKIEREHKKYLEHKAEIRAREKQRAYLKNQRDQELKRLQQEAPVKKEPEKKEPETKQEKKEGIDPKTKEKLYKFGKYAAIGGASLLAVYAIYKLYKYWKARRDETDDEDRRAYADAKMKDARRKAVAIKDKYKRSRR